MPGKCKRYVLDFEGVAFTIWHVSYLQLKSRIYTVKSYGDDEHKVESRFLKSTEVGTTS